MNTSDLLEQAEWKILKLEYLKTFILENSENIEKFIGYASIYDEQIHFNYVDRETTLGIIKAFPGKWKKNFRESEGLMDYTTIFNGVTLHCWGSPPPCKIIKEEIDIPEQVIPARKVFRHKLDCSVMAKEDEVLV